jgi:hypothetical protein
MNLQLADDAIPLQSQKPQSLTGQGTKLLAAALMSKWSRSSYALHLRVSFQGNPCVGQISVRKVPLLPLGLIASSAIGLLLVSDQAF